MFTLIVFVFPLDLYLFSYVEIAGSVSYIREYQNQFNLIMGIIRK